MTTYAQPEAETPDENAAEGGIEEEAAAQGPLLDEPDLKKVAATIIAKCEAQKKQKSKLGAVCRRNRAWRRGIRGVKIVEDTDRDEYSVRAPIGSAQTPIPNKVNLLIEKTVAVLTSDRPVPDVSPSSMDDQDVDAAEFATQLLMQMGGESGSNDTALFRWALNIAGTYKSAFIYGMVDPTGGGRVPTEVFCHPDVTQYDPANPDACLQNPATGVPIDESEAVIKYLHPGNVLSKSKAGAVMRWVNAIVPDVVTSEVVWLHPPTCRGIHDAQEVTIGRVLTLGVAKSLYPDLAKRTNEELSKLVQWRPQTNVRGWLPAHFDDVQKDQSAKLLQGPDGNLTDDNLLFAYHHYIKQNSVYERGAFVCVVGGSEVPMRSPWAVTVGDGDDAEDIALDLPLSQFRWKDDPVDRDPMGIAGAEDLGPMDEVRAAQMLAALEWLYRFNRPIQYLPAGSPLQGKNVALARENQAFVTVNMDGSGRPISETVAPLPPLVLQIYDALGNEMDEVAGVPKSLQGLTQNGVSSGKMQNQQIEQALQTLAPIFQNLEDALTRWWRIELQLMRAFYDVPRLAKIGSQDGDYRRKAFTGADLKSATDVTIKRGTFTAMTASAKRAMAAEEFQLALATKDPAIVTDAWQRYQDATARGLSSAIGIEDDPIEQRIKGALAAWNRGPSDAQLQQFAQWQQTQQSMQAAQQAQQASLSMPMPEDGPAQPMAPPAAPPPPDPLYTAAAQLFAPVSSDALPQVAPVRLRLMVKAQQGRRYANAEPSWRQAFDEALQAAQQAAGVQSIPDQQQQAQQAQEKAAQTEVQVEGAKAKAKADAEMTKELTVQSANDKRDTSRLLLDHALHGDQQARQASFDQQAQDADHFYEAQERAGEPDEPEPA